MMGDELLDLIQRQSNGGRIVDNSALTSTEISEKLGMGRTQTLVRLRREVREGRVERVWRRTKDTMGRSQLIPAYRVVRSKKAGKEAK